jgi:hypothetical protein
LKNFTNKLTDIKVKSPEIDIITQVVKPTMKWISKSKNFLSKHKESKKKLTKDKLGKVKFENYNLTHLNCEYHIIHDLMNFLAVNKEESKDSKSSDKKKRRIKWMLIKKYTRMRLN